MGGKMSNYNVEVTMSGITTQTNVQQDLWETIEADVGSGPATSPTDTLTLTGGTGIETTYTEPSTDRVVTFDLADTAVTPGTCTPGAITVDQQGRITATSVTPVAYVHAYLPNPTDTTITTAGTYYPITGPFTNDLLIGFILDVDHLEYSGPTTRYFEIDWHATIAADTLGTIVHVGVSINSAAPIAISATTCRTANDDYAFSATTVVELETDDEVQLVISSDGNGDVITVDHFTTTIRPI